MPGGSKRPDTRSCRQQILIFTILSMRAPSRTAQDLPELEPGTAEILQAATRVLAGVALRSLDVLDGAVTLPQFRMLAVLADLGQARSGQVARVLGLDASTVTRLADRLAAAGHVTRGSEPGHRNVVTLELTARRAAGQPGHCLAGAGAGADPRAASPRWPQAGNDRAAPASRCGRRGIRDDLAQPGPGVSGSCRLTSDVPPVVPRPPGAGCGRRPLSGSPASPDRGARWQGRATGPRGLRQRAEVTWPGPGT